jgi:dipeptidyl aminopeptidase/acylaminoacyl peptidase
MSMKKLAFSHLLLLVYCLSANAQQLITAEWLWSLGRISDPQVSPDGKNILYGVTYYDLKENKGNRDLYVMALESSIQTRITQTAYSENNARWRPDGQWIGFLSAESGSLQIWEMKPDGSAKRQISNIPGGVEGFSYSPDSKSIAWAASVKLDQALAEKYPDLPKANAFLTDQLMYRHWDSWHEYSYHHFFFAPYQEGASISAGKDLLEGERFHSPLMPMGGMEDMTWSSDGKSIVYSCKKKSGTAYAVSTNTDLYRYELSTGKTQNLTEGMMGYDMQPGFSPDGRYLSWLSMARDGFEADKEVLYIKEMSTGKNIALSAAFEEGVQNYSWSKDSKSLYFTSYQKGTKQVFAIQLADQKVRLISSGDHDINEVLIAGNKLVGTRNTMIQPAELVQIDPKSGAWSPLTKINQEAVSKVKWPTVEKRMIKTTDGKEMLSWLILPPEMDRNRKHPALLYCQGGPQSAVSQFFSYRWNFALMASQGYVVVAPNRRGLPGFGREWNDAISGDWGGQAIRDYLSAIDAAAQEPFVNKEKLGAVGASYGGYSVYQLAGVHEKRFKALVAHCGLYNLESWYGSTEELFFANWDMKGAPWDQPRPVSYDRFSPHLFARNWDSPILVIHGEKDFRVPITQGMEAFQAAQVRNIPSRFLYFPEEGHWVMKPQNSVLWNRVFFEWLDQWLK